MHIFCDVLLSTLIICRTVKWATANSPVSGGFFSPVSIHMRFNKNLSQQHYAAHKSQLVGFRVFYNNYRGLKASSLEGKT